MKTIDHQIINEQDRKQEQLRDHFTYDASKDKAHLDIYLTSMERQLDANDGFKKIYDKNFVGLQKTIEQLNNNLEYKLSVLKDKMQIVQNQKRIAKGMPVVRKDSTKSFSSQKRSVQGKMSTFYK